MAEEKKERRALIEYTVVKPFVDAAALGLAVAGPASFSDRFIQGFVAGSSFSLFWYWIKGNRNKPAKQSRARTNSDYLLINGRKVSRFEQAYITRDSNTLVSFWNNVIRSSPPQKRIEGGFSIAKPPILSEFTFHSRYSQIEVLESDARRFLMSAWRNKERGSGLSQRRWVRNWRQRPQWYRDLGPSWYFAFLGVMRESQQITGHRLVVTLGHQQYGLKHDPHTTLAILKWAETQKVNGPQSAKIA